MSDKKPVRILWAWEIAEAVEKSTKGINGRQFVDAVDYAELKSHWDDAGKYIEHLGETLCDSIRIIDKVSKWACDDVASDRLKLKKQLADAEKALKAITRSASVSQKKLAHKYFEKYKAGQ